jgi:hypothetical protein
MKKVMSVLMVVCFMVSMISCGGIGKSARTIEGIKSTDEDMSCEMLKLELESVKADYIRTHQKNNQKYGYNTACAVLGFFLIFPYFMADLSETEYKEMDQLKLRYNNLVELSKMKNCSFANDYPKIIKFENPGEDPNKDDKIVVERNTNN